MEFSKRVSDFCTEFVPFSFSDLVWAVEFAYEGGVSAIDFAKKAKEFAEEEGREICICTFAVETVLKESSFNGTEGFVSDYRWIEYTGTEPLKKVIKTLFNVDGISLSDVIDKAISINKERIDRQGAANLKILELLKEAYCEVML